MAVSSVSSGVSCVPPPCDRTLDGGISGFAISHSPCGTIQLHVPGPMLSQRPPHHTGHRLRFRTGLDLRLVRYITAVAEHRYFGRAAAALHITQPSLSRQVRCLERKLGASLLDRTRSRHPAHRSRRGPPAPRQGPAALSRPCRGVPRAAAEPCSLRVPGPRGSPRISPSDRVRRAAGRSRVPALLPLPYAVGGGVRMPKRWRRARRAAWVPAMPWTPGPGGVEAEQR